jgi:hypothetical protein
MFFAEITKDEVAFKAFETEQDAVQWIIDELGSDYQNDFWVGSDGKLHRSGRCFDFTVCVHDSLASAIVNNSGLDPSAAIGVLRALSDAIERTSDL